MTLEIQVLAWDRHKHVVGLNGLIGSKLSPLDNWILHDNTHKQTIRNLQRFTSTQKDHTISQK